MELEQAPRPRRAERRDRSREMQTKSERGAEVRSKDSAVTGVANGTIIQSKEKHKHLNGEDRSIAVECTGD